MKLFFVLPIYLTVALAQFGPPACVTTCLSASAAQAGGCSMADTACLCKSQTFLSAMQSCISSNCSGADTQYSSPYRNIFCASAGATVTVTSIASATSPSATATAAQVSSVPSSVTRSNATTSSTQPTGSGTSTISAAGAAQTSAASDTSSEGSGSGKYIGIGIGVGVACAVSLGGFMVWFILRRRKLVSAGKTWSDHDSEAIGAASEAGADSSDGRPYNEVEYKRTMQRVHEMEAAKRHAQELEAKQRYEMEDSQDPCAMLAGDEKELPPKYRNSMGPSELP